MIRVLSMLCALLLSPAARAAEGPDDLVAEARSANPSLSSLRHRAAALSERAEVAGAWTDPTVAVEYANAPVTTLSVADHPMAGIQLKVQQTLRPPGWSGAQRDAASQRAEAGAHAVDEAALALDLAVRKAWWQLARTRLLRRVTEEHVALTDELLQAVRARYETGGVGQHALLRLQVLRDRLTDDLGEFDRTDAALVAALQGALSAPADRAFPTPDAVDPIRPPEAADHRALAEAHRPLLARLRAERSAAEQAARAARLDGLPDPTLWAGYRVRTVHTDTDPGTDLVSVGVGIPLPAGSGRRARGSRAAALEEAGAAGASIDATLDAIDARMGAILAAWTRAWDKTATYDGTLIPAARSTLDTTRADFSVDRADFASLFDAEVALLDLQRARIAAAVETHIQRAEAIAVLGVPLPGGAP